MIPFSVSVSGESLRTVLRDPCAANLLAFSVSLESAATRLTRSSSRLALSNSCVCLQRRYFSSGDHAAEQVLMTKLVAMRTVALMICAGILSSPTLPRSPHNLFNCSTLATVSGE